MVCGLHMWVYSLIKMQFNSLQFRVCIWQEKLIARLRWGRKIMGRREPRVVCYRDKLDLVVLREWFYNFDGHKDLRERAVKRVKALESRGKLPHALASTSWLTSILLSEESSLPPPNAVLQLSYCMAMVKFVNGLLDPFQQASFAIPLHQLAKNLGLPLFFVELRHTGTHELMPNILILRQAAKDALNWLFDHYWLIIDLKFSPENRLLAETGLAHASGSEVTSSKEVETLVNSIRSHLSTFKKIRKQDLDNIIKYGNSTEIGVKYWNLIKLLRRLLAQSNKLVLDVMITRNYLISKRENGEKKKPNPDISTQIKIYTPLLEELGPHVKRELITEIVNVIKEFKLSTISPSYKASKLYIENSKEESLLVEWIKFLVSDLLQKESTSVNFSFVQLLDNIIEEISALDAKQQLEIISVLDAEMDKLKVEPQEKEKVKEKMNRTKQSLKLSIYEPPPSLDDLLLQSPVKPSPSEEDNNSKPSKKRKLDKKAIRKTFFLEPHDNWVPNPLGIAP